MLSTISVLYIDIFADSNTIQGIPEQGIHHHQDGRMSSEHFWNPNLQTSGQLKHNLYKVYLKQTCQRPHKTMLAYRLINGLPLSYKMKETTEFS